MIKEIDYVGIVVKDTQETASLLSNLFEFKISELIEVPEEGFRSTMIFKEEVTLIPR
jgi:hypothetical protein